MCSSGEKQCSIVFPTEIFLHQTSVDQHHVKINCSSSSSSSSSSCSLTDPQASIVLFRNRKPEQKKTFPLTSTETFTCAVKDLQDIHSADVCLDHSSCWTVNCFPKRICALKGSSLNISCEYSHPQHQQLIMKRWFKINRNINQKGEEIIEKKNKVKFYDSPNKHNLRFEKLSKSDSGEYVFEIGENSNDLKESTFPEVTLIVTDLRVEIRPSSEVTEGQKVTLTCSTSCPLTPNSNFHWYLNHQPLKGENKHLVIDAVTSQDAGNYSCVVKTKEIFMSSVKTLTVKSINTTTQIEIVGGVSPKVIVLVLVSVLVSSLICLTVFLWIRKKRTSTQSSSSEAVKNLYTLNTDHLYEEIPAEATDNRLHHSQVNHENTFVYSTIQAHQEQEHVPYAITKVHLGLPQHVHQDGVAHLVQHHLLRELGAQSAETQ
uniref:Ig-like domain-containing protein n=1 Tax=Oryzias melastigma TaxID=30732 RepID=A0A3B3CC84_ORYME